MQNKQCFSLHNAFSQLQILYRAEWGSEDYITEIKLAQALTLLASIREVRHSNLFATSIILA
jgi:hypothetical protein